MALDELVRYVSRCCARKPNCGDLYEMAERHNWDPGDVLAFLRCQKAPSRKMLREMAKELEVSPSELEHILNR